MALLFGIGLILLAGFAFVHSLPRGGRLARFVGTEWEGYAVTTMIGAFGIGVMLALVSFGALTK